MRKPLFAAVLLMSCIAGTERAEASDYQNVDNGNGLLADCDDEKSPFNWGVCRGFVSGVSDTMSGVLICYPSEVTNQQVLDVVVAGLRNHPEERHKWSSYLVAKYLAAAFPCPKKN